MILIFGGAYQGKADFAKEKFNILDSDICDLSKEKPDMDKKVMYHFENYVYENGDVRDGLQMFKDKIIISNDVSCGLVPISEKDRAFREDLGRVLTEISKESDEVFRVFMGLGVKIK
ncbi:MAG: bifunctional adenosylcobinamide kinase/adenosylcobinamide-phosphate guanylyltransferase [Clostridia bacterium]|nr:bifunctional adenosylcobinamide kinase/adenosylcobinamide-phosphate guanylyltransferase [Clostridia bacterium]